jgi:hypothetical protein
MALGCTSAITKRASDVVQTAPQPRWWEKSRLEDIARCITSAYVDRTPSRPISFTFARKRSDNRFYTRIIVRL